MWLNEVLVQLSPVLEAEKGPLILTHKKQLEDPMLYWFSTLCLSSRTKTKPIKWCLGVSCDITKSLFCPLAHTFWKGGAAKQAKRELVLFQTACWEARGMELEYKIKPVSRKMAPLNCPRKKAPSVALQCFIYETAEEGIILQTASSRQQAHASSLK